MAITNIIKPTTSLTNSLKVSYGETWGSITTTWAVETRTWLGVSQLLTNDIKVSGGTIYLTDDSGNILTDDLGNRLIISSGNGITNIPKP
jgi:hypothetical protein